MPNLSKKKGRRRFNPEREVAKAQRILEKHKTDKFLKKQGGSWKYGHLTPKQVMTGADKLFHSKVIKVSKSRGLADDTNDENPYYKSQYNDDRNLTNFEDDQIFRHQIRAINDNSDIDPSDSDIENDTHLLKNINDNDEIFSLPTNNNNDYNDYNDEEEFLESSGDDLDRDDDDDLLIQQNEDDNTIDIDTQIKNIQTRQIIETKETKENIETNKEKNKKSNKRGRRAMNVNGIEIETQIMNDNNENSKRLLNLSKQFNENINNNNNNNNNNGHGLYDHDSDGSSYYHSSDSDIEDIEDIERNKYKDKYDGDGDGEEGDDDFVAEEGVGKVFWGDKHSIYYGADGMNKQFKSKSEREQYKQLRDEEAIAIQMQKDEVIHVRHKDFIDLEMEEMMIQQMEEEEKQEKQEKQEKINVNTDDKMDEDEDEDEDEENEENEDEDKAVNVEIIRKEKVIRIERMDRMDRDHPELFGMIKELKEIISEMNMVYQFRQKAIEKRFDDGIEDSTLFIEILRTYSSTICFYLQLKAKKMDGNKLKKHGIYSILLKLKHRVSSFRKIYKKSMQFMNSLDAEWNRNKYLQEKRELFEYSKEKEKEIYEKRMTNEREKQKMEKIQKKKLRKQKKKEYELKKKLFKKGFNRLNNEDNKLEGEDMRRSITQKIFKSQGLKRYRKQGIPRVKARIKYQKKLKLWRRKGYKTFKQKLPNGRMEYNINTNMTHSKRLT